MTLGIVPVDRKLNRIETEDEDPPVWKIIKNKKTKIIKKNKYHNEKVLLYIAQAINDLHEMGHVDALNSKQFAKIIEFEIKKQIPNPIIEETFPTIDFEVKRFEQLNNYKLFNIIPVDMYNKFMKFSDDYIFIKHKNVAIHKILFNSNIADELLSYDK
ncbi:Uncharacterized protein FWK35_00023848 [Aphis craccivora]|uniref:Uncharacterized protein n=1 Tax=Aphis craccivora TaxID=307492 RepID=A0A6G0Y1A6_APHCR|nr:Uncharacterized protein FWK35_00023848 [Aphis craccivora]